LGDEDAALRGRVKLEEFGGRRRQAHLVWPAGIGHPSLAAPAAEAVIETLPADQPVIEIVASSRRDLLDRKHLLIDRPHVRHSRVEPRFGTAREIGMLAEAAW